VTVPARVEEPLPLEPAVKDGQPWERLKRETRQAFANFAAYRDMGPERSVRKLALDVKKSTDTLFDQSRRYRWQERIDQYEDYLDRRDREVRESERDRVNREGTLTFRRLQAVATKRLIGDHSDPRKPVDAIDPNDLEAADVARWLEIAWRGLRTATGQPTDYIAGKFQVSSEDFLRVVQGLYEIAARLVAEERRGRLASEFQAFLESGAT